MAWFLIGRAIQILAILIVMSFMVYLLIGVMPGDPIDLLVSSDPRLSAADAARLKALYGLDQPIITRYLTWLSSIMHGDWGFSRLYAKPVADVLSVAIGKTVILMGIAFATSVAIAIPAGMLAATRIRSKTDYVINLLCFAGISIPPFWLALMLILVFSVTLGWLPANSLPVGDVGLAERAKALVLPVITLTAVSVGSVTRYVRASLNEALRLDYVRTALAKGLAQSEVVRRHALRNSMIPVVTILSLDASAFFSGALITEIMFGYPGMGKLIFDSIQGSDYNLALAGLLIATAVTLAANFLADIGYAALDPRVTFKARR